VSKLIRAYHLRGAERFVLLDGHVSTDGDDGVRGALGKFAHDIKYVLSLSDR